MSLDAALREMQEIMELYDLSIDGFNPKNESRRIMFQGSYRPISKIFQVILDKAGGNVMKKFPNFATYSLSYSSQKELMEVYLKQIGLFEEEKSIQDKLASAPADMQDLTLNFDLSAKLGDEKFFLTTKNEAVSPVMGSAYLMVTGVNAQEAVAVARRVLPSYRPKGQSGVFPEIVDGVEYNIFNTYTPPVWRQDEYWNKASGKNLPDLFARLVNHLFPLSKERDYFFSWLYSSIFQRSFIYLILCGAPGTGKNRLKLVMRALHGHSNSVDGKKSTFKDRFNSQLSNNTLVWFDELHYDAEMENAMKEVQNDSISIERKGVDATRSTKIYASIVISNNKPRDNYIAFDARKFAPLTVTSKRLEESMSSAEIDLITQKVETLGSPDFDPMFLAEIAKWLYLNYDPKSIHKKFPNLEYRGPMFWSLAHTSMSRWQKRSTVLISEENKTANFGFDESKGWFKWSLVMEKALKKTTDRNTQFPSDYTTAKAFFEIFRGNKGEKVYEVESIPGDIFGDFYVRLLPQKESVKKEVKGGKTNVKKGKFRI